MKKAAEARTLFVVVLLLPFLLYRKLLSCKAKTLREDAHCDVQCRCRKRPPQARECALAHSLFLQFLQVLVDGVPGNTELLCQVGDRTLLLKEMGELQAGQQTLPIHFAKSVQGL